MLKPDYLSEGGTTNYVCRLASLTSLKKDLSHMHQTEKATPPTNPDSKMRVGRISFSRFLTLVILVGVVPLPIFAGCEKSRNVIDGLENIQDEGDKKQEKIDELTKDH